MNAYQPTRERLLTWSVLNMTDRIQLMTNLSLAFMAVVATACASAADVTATPMPKSRPTTTDTGVITGQLNERSPQTPTLPISQNHHEDADPDLADGSVNPLDVKAVEEIIKYLPLRSNVVSFSAIDKFITIYAPFTSNKALLRSIRQNCQRARALLETDLSVFSLGMTVEEIATKLKPPAGSNVNAFYTFVLTAVSHIRDSLLEFNEAAREILTREQEEALSGQTDGSHGLARQNIRDIERGRQRAMDMMAKERRR